MRLDRGTLEQHRGDCLTPLLSSTTFIELVDERKSILEALRKSACFHWQCKRFRLLPGLVLINAVVLTNTH